MAIDGLYLSSPGSLLAALSLPTVELWDLLQHLHLWSNLQCLARHWVQDQGAACDPDASTPFFSQGRAAFKYAGTSNTFGRGRSGGGTIDPARAKCRQHEKAARFATILVA